jgi:phenylacetate-coenzyme A ligase PaaK-like adenylate-forming protein
MFWEKDIETMDVSELKELQLDRLRTTLIRATATPYYSQLFKKISFDPTEVRDLAKMS